MKYVATDVSVNHNDYIICGFAPKKNSLVNLYKEIYPTVRFGGICSTLFYLKKIMSTFVRFETILVNVFLLLIRYYQ